MPSCSDHVVVFSFQRFSGFPDEEDGDAIPLDLLLLLIDRICHRPSLRHSGLAICPICQDTPQYHVKYSKYKVQVQRII